MYTILIVEDDIIQNKAIYEAIHRSYPNWHIHTSYNLEEAQSLLKQSVDNQDFYSMFLLDIQLSEDTLDEGGFEFAKQIRSQTIYYKTPILFLTSIHDKTSFALSNFHCYNYIVKPYSENNILFEIKQMLLTGYLTVHSVMITDINRINHRVIISDIIYIEAKSHMIMVHTTNGVIPSRENSISSLQNNLTDNFIQCHQKYIINIEHLNNYDRKNRYVRVDSVTLPVSRSYKESFETRLRLNMTS